MYAAVTSKTKRLCYITKNGLGCGTRFEVRLHTRILSVKDSGYAIKVVAAFGDCQRDYFCFSGGKLFNQPFRRIWRKNVVNDAPDYSGF